eukprot:TRINITY_DN5112_c0_g1_i1.p1 TRINITY_DN5112_c0_g1~~TRINITY_DN5112_c0_g1_i1.p1  ORF type:complete len:1300 (-),score=221.72 TRINITY_DN5112_c0_g1_i1:44-3889(-)
MPAAMSPSNGEKIATICRKFDINGDGVIDRNEFRKALNSIDPVFFTDATIRKLFTAADADHDGTVDYREFVAWITQEPVRVYSRLVDDGPGRISVEEAEQIQQACRKLDMNRDGSCSSSELSQVLGKYLKLSAEDIAGLMDCLDLNKDSVIQYAEFVRWIRLPSDDRLSFADFLNATTERETVSMAPVSYSRGAPAGGFSDQGDRPSLIEFTHPVLTRCSVQAEDASSGVWDKASTVVVSMQKEATFGRIASRTSASLKGVRSFGGRNELTVAAPQLKVSMIGSSVLSTGEDWAHDAVVLQGLADTYGQVLEGFCAAIASKSLPGEATLRFPPFQLLDRYARGVHCSPEMTWSALALAISRLHLTAKDELEEGNMVLCVPRGSDDDADAYVEALKAKQSAAARPVEPRGDGAVVKMDGSHTWIRKDRSEEGRFRRLQAFLMTHRSVMASGYVFNGKTVELKGVDYMLARTHIRTPCQRLVTMSGTVIKTDVDPILPKAGAVDTVLTNACQSGFVSVMEVAQRLSEAGKKVAAVNAASAYHCGGGVSSGGRHALEEAWCIISTLYRSLLAVEPVKVDDDEASAHKEFHQHIPTTSCVVSEQVEVFRKPTNEGYGFIETPVTLMAVLSVAMFNRNPSVSDSPLDSPADPKEYAQQTKAKVEAVICAAIDVGAEVLVVPDVGCGVFRNDSRLVGGLFGLLLRKYNGHIKEVVTASSKQAFHESCELAFNGKDPRGPGYRGDIPRDGSDPVEAALIDIAMNPEDVKQPECRYGAACSISSERHRKQFSHPCPPAEHPTPASLGGGSSAVGARTGASGGLGGVSGGGGVGGIATRSGVGSSGDGTAGTRMGVGSPARGASPSRGATGIADPTSVGDPTAGRSMGVGPTDLSRVGSRGKPKRVCRYGEKCYQRSKQHMEDFDHPWLRGESAEEEVQRKTIELSHQALTMAKGENWEGVKEMLRKNPEIVNVRPEQREFNLLHFATFQFNHTVVRQLVRDYGADLTTKSSKGKTAIEILTEGMVTNPGKPEETAEDTRLLNWMKLHARTGDAGDDLRASRRGYSAATTTPSGVGTGGPSPSFGGGGVGTTSAGSMGVSGLGVGGGGPSPSFGGGGVGTTSAGSMGVSGLGVGGGGTIASGSAPAGRPGTSGFGATGAEAEEEEETDEEDTPRFRSGRTKLSITCCTYRSDLVGDYWEMKQKYNDKCVWKRKVDSNTNMFIFYSKLASIGWAIDRHVQSSRTPVGYNNRLLGRPPFTDVHGATWKIYRQFSTGHGGYHSEDYRFQLLKM